MAAIQDLPEEVICAIFDRLKNNDLRQCRQVCYSWKLPAHKLLLQTIHLNGAYQIDLFIKSIDHNPDPSYLAAVKQIVITTHGEIIPDHYWLTEEKIKKFFCRFPNLEAVYDDTSSDCSMYSEFNDDICRELLKSCPKLHTFRVSSGLVCYDYLLKLRLVVTDVNLSDTRYYGSSVSCLSNFSRLRSLTINAPDLTTFEDVLPVFESLPHLTKLETVYTARQEASDSQEGFAEQYLATKTKHEQDVILERLSKVTELIWRNRFEICLNNICFITNYLTGLKRLELLFVLHNASINRQQYQLFCSSLLDLFCSTIDCHLDIRLKTNDLLELFALGLLHKVYRQPASQKTLTLNVTNPLRAFATDSSRLNIIRKPDGQRKLSIQVTGETNFNNIMTSVFSRTVSLDEVGSFQFQLSEGQDIDVIVRRFG